MPMIPSSFSCTRSVIMSKQSRDVLDEDMPPPYSPIPSSQTSHTLPSLFSSHFRDISSRISSARAARTSERDERDSEILALLVPHIEGFIQSITAMNRPPRLLEMTMVPEGSVGKEWIFSDEDQTRKVVRIREDAKLKGDSKGKPETPRQREFDDWGRWDEPVSSAPDESLWWSDDEMASRLAKYLQPERPRRVAPLPFVAPVQPRKSSGWGMFKKPDAPPSPSLPSQASRNEEEEVSMTVKAEEVTFRRENEMGIWESKTGWGLVVSIRIRQ
ncbi:hypothetical protein EDB81DRAFT_451779 [Dactylonectria macrodidyma]|uniref:Uncharacterized protein n=1 Tax=Dactylonectria macrodidyma TaxID=307937 RepID=A0A9P9F522_9HYPO|nr:hypothetical protein EDB81DRAFT_451779 [Dactylonectria macrodidyma]